MLKNTKTVYYILIECFGYSKLYVYVIALIIFCNNGYQFSLIQLIEMLPYKVIQRIQVKTITLDHAYHNLSPIENFVTK